MMTDCHSHILPEMDDGSDSIEMSCSMLELLRHREKSVAAYLEKRQRQFAKLKAANPAVQNIFLGAEVAIEKGLSDTPDIEKLAIQGTDLILLELPYAPYQEWMEEEIDNIAITYRLTPVIAHVHRYLNWYNREQTAHLLQLDAVLQINIEAFQSFSQKRIAKEVIKRELPFLFGSDCHNLTDRKPNFEILQKKVRPEIIEKSNRLLECHMQ